MYLPRWVKFLESHSGTMSESDQIDSHKAIYRLTLIFTGMIHWLEGRRTYIAADVREVLTRRCVDFLAVILVNIGMLSPQPTKSKKLFADVQKVRLRFHSNEIKGVVLNSEYMTIGFWP